MCCYDVGFALHIIWVACTSLKYHNEFLLFGFTITGFHLLPSPLLKSLYLLSIFLFSWPRRFLRLKQASFSIRFDIIFHYFQKVQDALAQQQASNSPLKFLGRVYIGHIGRGEVTSTRLNSMRT